jgi:hypothetical protein
MGGMGLHVWDYYWWGGTKSLGTAATSGILYKPQMIDEDDCGAIGGMKIGRGNRSTRRKPAPAPLCPPQIPHDQTRARNPGLRGGKPATNRLSYGAAFCVGLGDASCLDCRYRNSQSPSGWKWLLYFDLIAAISAVFFPLTQISRSKT